MMLYLPSLVSMIHITMYLDGWVLLFTEHRIVLLICYYVCMCMSVTEMMVGIFQEQNHLRAAAVLMTFAMVVAVLTSIAIIRRILRATSVLKVYKCLILQYKNVE